MSVLTPDLFHLTAQEVLDCVCEALAEQSSCGCPCRACVVVGQPVWDACCDGGQLTAFVNRIFVHDAFPATEGGSINCMAPLAGDFTLQLIRCVPTVTDDGVAPTCEALSDSARLIYEDMYIALRAVICCLAAYKKKRSFAVRDTRTVGPQGGCAGFEIQFTVQLLDPIPEV